MQKMFIQVIKQKWQVVLIYLLSLLLFNICLIIYPLYLNHILATLNHLQWNEVMMFIVLSLLIPLFSFLKDRTLNYTDNILSIYLADDLLQKIFKKDVLQVKKFSANYINRAINNYSGLVCNFYLYNVLDTFISLISTIIMIIILANQNIYLALFIVVVNLLRLFIVASFNSKIEQINQEKIKAENHYYHAFNSYIVKLKSIILRDQSNQASHHLKRLSKSYSTHANQYSKPIGLVSMMNSAGVWIIHFLTILFALVLSKAMVVTIYLVQLAFSYSQTITNSFQSIVSLFPSYATVHSFYKVVEELLRLEDLKSDGCTQAFKRLELKNLTFGYDEDKLMINHLNYQFETGYLYVITGENGTGKSTLLKLMAGMYSKYQGQILLDDTPLNLYNLQYYQGYLTSVLTQEDLLFEDNIANNILEEDIEKIRRICTYLEIDELDKSVLPQGSNLSGGERRKILLARVLLEIERKKPSLVIFDEPTYALEPQLADKVIALLKELALSTIVIVITHDHLDKDKFYPYCKSIELSIDK